MTTQIGQRRTRVEDRRLITGQTTWTDSVAPPGVCHVAFLRSPMARARITRVDVAPARSAAGVLAAFSGRDLADEQGSLPCGWNVAENQITPDHPPLAVDEVRYAGEPVACVVAADRYTAIDALELIDIDYEPLDPVLDMEAAIADGAPAIHAEHGTNLAFDHHFGNGDIDAAFRDAPVVLTRRYIQQRLIPSAMEPRAVAVTVSGDEYTVYSSTQIPHILRTLLAMVTGIDEHRLRVVARDVGGGFGSKLQLYNEEVLCLLLTRKLGRPVKWTESRSEGGLATHHGRDQIQDISIAADRDGRIRGLKVDLLVDMGAYMRLGTPGVPMLGSLMFNGIYKMDAYSFHCRGVFTNKTSTDAYRGAGRPEATYAIERIVTDLAAELGVDPIELRRRNWIKHEEFPYETVSGLTYDSGNYEAATDRAMELFGYDALRAEQAERRASGDPVQLGLGVSTYTEMCGLAPSRMLGTLGYSGGAWEHASVRVLPTGKVEVVTGTAPHGQGHETAWMQIAADALGVPFSDIKIVYGDTSTSPKGLDTYGSRSLAVGGVAVHTACERVVDKARRAAAHLLEAAEEDLEFNDGKFSVRGVTDTGTTLAEVVQAVWATQPMPVGFEASVDSDSTWEPPNYSYPHGTHLCAVEVDTETGFVKIRSYVCVDDVGRAINPMIVDGQVHGGLAQGIAQALYEEAVYDAQGNLLTTTFADYLLPSAADLPDFVTDRTETPATENPLGVKGVGEAGTIASTPAVVNAVVDALRPYGIDDIRMPCTPERVWAALQQAGDTGDRGNDQAGGAAR
jgi:carbon-monoxide dehydrogenase large subunit